MEDFRSKTDEEGLLFAVSGCTHKTGMLYYGYYNQVKMQNCNKTYDAVDGKDNGEPILGYSYMDGMLGSCNGLVCFQKQWKLPYVAGKPFLICNPLTGKVVDVPDTHTRLHPHMSGFGYCHSTKEYKIIRICSDFELPKQARAYLTGEKALAAKYYVQVYTVGGGGGGGEWRNKESINFEKRAKKESIHASPVYSAGVHANGAIHWLHKRVSYLQYEDYVMAAFDLEDESFQFIPLPILREVNYEHRLKLLGGNNLYMVYTIHDGPYQTVVWAYKRKTTSNADGSYVDLQDKKKKKKVNYNDKNLWHWVKEFNIEWEEPYRSDLVFIEPLAITRNDALVLRNKHSIYCYDLKTSTLNKIYDGCAMCSNNINVIPHTNNSVIPMSLEDPHANSIVSMSLKDPKDGAVFLGR